jgi:hypothetical protein
MTNVPTSCDATRHVEASDGPGWEVPASPVSGCDDAKPGKCPYPRSLSYATWEYSIQLDYAGLTKLMDHVFEVWDLLNLDAKDQKIGDAFEGLIEHVAELREWTGWGGVAGTYTGAGP